MTVEEIFSSDALHAAHARGDPAFGTLIRYSGALVGRDETPRWAANLVKQWRGDTILITPRDKGYFAPCDMAPLIERFPPLRRPVVCVGSSMGGYGALKYSRRLGADAVLAFAPQYSVHPEEAPFDPERHAFHDPDRQGNMAITPEDISGKVAIFYDPKVRVDSLHALAIHARLRGAMPVALVPVTYSSHVIVTLMDNAWKVQKSVDLTLGMDEPGLRAFYRKLKRYTPRYRIELAVAAARRAHFRWAEAVLRDAAATHGWTRSLHFAQARVLQAKGDAQAAHHAAEAGISAHESRPEGAQFMLAGALAQSAGQPGLALAHFRAARDTDPFRPLHHMVYARTLLEQQMYAEAIEALESARARFPADGEIDAMLSSLRRERGALSRLMRKLGLGADHRLWHSRPMGWLRHHTRSRWPGLTRAIRRHF